MPTGYTEILERRPETTLAEFAMRCARAFGYLYRMRDEPLDAPVPKRLEPEPYYKEAMEKAEAELAKFTAMSRGERLEWGQQSKRTSLKSYREGNSETADRNIGYKAMKLRVERWEPPTKDHEGLKKFMLEQIETSMYSESSMSDTIAALEARDPMEVATEHLNYLRGSAKNRRDDYERHIKHVAEANEWLNQLRESLRREVQAV